MQKLTSSKPELSTKAFAINIKFLSDYLEVAASTIKLSLCKPFETKSLGTKHWSTGFGVYLIGFLSCFSSVFPCCPPSHFSFLEWFCIYWVYWYISLLGGCNLLFCFKKWSWLRNCLSLKRDETLLTVKWHWHY